MGVRAPLPPVSYTHLDVYKRQAIHRINISVNHVIEEEYRQYSMFTDVRELERNRKLQTAMLDIKKKFGKNAILKGINLQEASTMQERNQQIGGHKSGIYKDGGNKSKERGLSLIHI